MEKYEHSGVKWTNQAPWRIITSGNITLADASLYYLTTVGFYWNSTSMMNTDANAMLDAWKGLYPSTSYAHWFGYSVRCIINTSFFILLHISLWTSQIF